MAVTTWTAGQVLAAADLNDTFASKLPYSYGTATPSTTDSGYLWYDSNSTPAAPKFWDGAAFQALTSGKILQVVRATDSSSRSTTSTTFTDLTGMTVTITPQKSDSAILLIATCAWIASAGTNNRGKIQLTDASNNAISGAEAVELGSNAANVTYDYVTLVGYSTPATTSAVTYKLRFLSELSTVTITITNNICTGQVYAIEVSA